VETIFKSPGPTPNGLQATPDGLWILDAGDNKIYLVQYDGKVIRSAQTEATVGSGITFGAECVWVANTPQRTILKIDPMTGQTIQKYPTPGAGVQYRMAGDPPQRRSPLQPAPADGARGGGGQGAGRGRGQASPGESPGTGANGLEWQDGKVFMAVPPARQVFTVDGESWVVQSRFNTLGNRAHGVGWEGKYLWVTDSNLNGFVKHDASTGEPLEKITVGEKDPLPHGMTIWQGGLWYCDEVGVICRLKLG
jgi:hypothetical protein